MWLGRAKLFSAAVAVLVGLAWITGTNHCVLGLMNHPSSLAASASHCPGHSQQSGGARDGASGMLACCQGLLSPKLEVVKASIPFPVLVAIQVFATDRVTRPQDSGRVLYGSQYDTGPPSNRYFVEVVLKRSLPENAPPALP